MFRALLLMGIFATQFSFAAPATVTHLVGTITNLDAARVDFTLFVKVAGDKREFRVIDTNNQSPTTTKTISALQKSLDATTAGQKVPVDIAFTNDLVIQSATVKN